MLTNYLKIAWRNLIRNKTFSLINIAGLALGIAAFVLILEYVAYERSYNQFHKNLPTLYRLLTQNQSGAIWSDMSPPIGPLAKEKFPEVRDFCRIAEHSANGIVSLPGGQTVQSFREGKLAYADASFFTLFTFPLVRGTAATALSRPNTVALSESHARLYFGNRNPIGQTLTLNNQFGKTLYTVTAVYADMPQQSDLSFDAVFALQTLNNPANLGDNDWARLDSFYGTYLTTFLQLSDANPTDYKALEAKINVVAKQINPTYENQFLVQPATTLHLATSLSDVYQTSGSLGFVYLLSGIAGLILLIAWFNYVNLSTAGALKRAKEVGVRKVIGAGPGQLVGQFLGESLLLNGLGVGLGLLLVIALQPTFNEFIQRELSLNALNAGGFWLAGLGLVLVGAVASGGYVAFTMTSFQPVQTLKGTYRGGNGGWLRKTLVVAQFSASVALVIATMVLYRQLQYVQTKDLGLQLTQRVVIKGPQVDQNGSFKPGTAALEDELSRLPYVKNFCQTSIIPGNLYNFSANGITKQNPRSGDDKQTYSMGIIDDRFLDTTQSNWRLAGILRCRKPGQATRKAPRSWSTKRAYVNWALRRPRKPWGSISTGGNRSRSSASSAITTIRDYNGPSSRSSSCPAGRSVT